jgi:hypothetical protein
LGEVDVERSGGGHEIDHRGNDRTWSRVSGAFIAGALHGEFGRV